MKRTMKKKINSWIFSLIIMSTLLLLTNSCEKDDDTAPAEPETETETETEIGTLTDIDGNIYNTIKIGNQWWMAENLKTIKYNDDTSIPIVTDNDVWYNLTTPGYCWYNNDAETYKATYGALYNFHTVNTGKLCPTGWHVPTYTEWETLITFLGGKDLAGGKLIEKGTAHWVATNDEVTNESGFTALPGGFRMLGFSKINERGYWMMRKDFDDQNLSRLLLLPGGTIDIWRSTSNMGYSVRCVKD